LVPAALLSLLVATAAGSCTGGDHDERSAPSAPAGTTGQPSATGSDALGEVIDHVEVLAPHYDLSVPGGIVVVAEGEEIRSYAFGDARLHPRRPMRATDRFPIGSNSKTLLATAVLQLVDEGAVSLDDPVERWKPGLVPAGDRITVEDLLSHRSGLPDPLQRRGYDLGTDLTDPTLRELLDHPLTDPPGTRSRYSNANYVVLGKIVEAVTGHSLSRVLQERIFDPAGMTSAALATAVDRLHLRTRGYDPHGHDVTPHDLSGAWGAGSVVASAQDLARFYRALYAGGLLPTGARTDMVTPRGTLPDGPGYGLGTMLFGLQCADAVGHGGELPGFESLALHDPDTGRTVVTAVNQSGSTGIDATESLAVEAFCYR
jgi:D-alanyl-D-alanine carboxypeptidase